MAICRHSYIVGVFDLEYGRYPDDPFFDDDKVIRCETAFYKIKPEVIRRNMIVNSRKKQNIVLENEKATSDLWLDFRCDIELGQLADHYIEDSNKILCRGQSYIEASSLDIWFLKTEVQHAIHQYGRSKIESPEERRERLAKRKEELSGTKGFVKQIAKEENLSEGRIKQLLTPRASASKKTSDRGDYV